MICLKCKEDKPDESFTKFGQWCYQCRRTYKLEWKYGNPAREQQRQEWMKNYMKSRKWDPRGWQKDARSAHQKVWYAIKVGKLSRPSNCSNCLAKTKPQGHHEDYSKPLEVIWLCRSCHQVHHKLKS